jgi:hypothetical protein
MSNIVTRKDDLTTNLVQVEAFIFDPLTPIVMAIHDFDAVVALTVEEAEQAVVALQEAINKVNGGI